MPLITSRLSPVHRVRFAQFGPVVAVCVCASYTYKALYCRGLYTRKIAGRQQFLIIPLFMLLKIRFFCRCTFDIYAVQP